MKKEFYSSTNEKMRSTGPVPQRSDGWMTNSRFFNLCLFSLFTFLGYTGLQAQCFQYDAGPYTDQVIDVANCDGGSVSAPYSAWNDEIYFTTVTPGGNYTFELVGCDQTTWGGPVSITVINGGTAGAGSVVGGTEIATVTGVCDVTFDAPAGAETIWFIVTAACGSTTVFDSDNGVPTVTTNSGQPCVTGPCTAYVGGPFVLGTASCQNGASVAVAFEAWENEAYFMEVQPGANYTFELVGCSQTAWGGPFDLTVISGGLPDGTNITGGTIIASGSGTCDITFDAPAGSTAIWVTMTTNCGGPEVAEDNGFPTITTNSGAACNTDPCFSYSGLSGAPFGITAPGCDAGNSENVGVAAWENEIYVTDVVAGGNYTFELAGCDPSGWGAPVVLTVIGGGIDDGTQILGGEILASSVGNCDVTFDVPMGVNQAWFTMTTACGGIVTPTDNGDPTITVNSVSCPMFAYDVDDTCNTPFTDISGTGTALNLTDDGTAAITMPFDFEFFGELYPGPSTHVVGNNGGIIMNTAVGGVPFGNGALPAGTAPAVLPFWDDFDDETGNVYWEVIGTAPNQQLIVQWNMRPHWPGSPTSNTGTIQAVFYEGSNEISFIYEDVDFGDPAIDNGASATIGVQSGIFFEEYSFNTASLAGVTCINFSLPTVCGDAFLDSGGLAGTYGNNENSTTTICPDTPDACVEITFTSFDVEQSVFTGNCFDALSVYAGADATADLIDVFCGNDLAAGDADMPGPFISSAPGECITFVLNSNVANAGDGWVAEVTCPDDCLVETCNTSVVVCNDNVQISLDEDCTTLVTPDMVLEGACSNSFYSVEIFNEEGTSIGDELTSAEVNTVVSVHVTHTESGNYCWGTLTVEDKLNPVIECPCPADGPITSIVGELTESDPTYNRAFVGVLGCTPSGVGTDVYYDTNVFTVDADGVYTFLMMFPGDGNASLYEGSFDPDNPCDNLIAYDDDNGGGLDPLIITALIEAGTYILVTSSWGNGDTGAYSWFLSGDGGIIGRSGQCNYTCVDLAGLLDGSIQAAEATATDNCGDPEISVEDEVADNGCEGTVIIRSYVATDASGNTDACAQEIYLRPLTLDDIIRNGQVDIACDDLDEYPSPAALDAAGIDGAYPTVISEGIEFDVNGTLCNVGSTYEDAPIIDLCGGGYKIVRTWTIFDWCEQSTDVYAQIIKVVDEVAPVINTCPEYDVVAASPNPDQCNGIVIIQDLTDYTENCSDPTSLSILFTMASGNEFAVEVGESVQAGVGTHTITYTIADACGNESSCATTVTIEDQTPPVTICDEHTTASVGSDGNAEICWETFNDGTYDNCGPIVIKVKRMDASSSTPFTDCVNFDCADVGSTIMVRMRAYDITPDSGFPDSEDGRWNECMIEVSVEDKLPPIISCPADKTADCQTPTPEFDGITPDPDLVIDNDPQYPVAYYVHADGTEEFIGYYAGALDNCNATVYVEDSGDLDQCGEGTIYRTWTVVDPGNLTDICTQTIEIINDESFDENDIDWPRDADGSRSVDCGDGTEPEDLRSGFQFAEVTEDACDLVAVTYEDQLLPVVDSACYKILRTWTVIDWCQFDGSVQPNLGVWTHIQIIKVRDVEGPEVVSYLPAAGEICTYTNDCFEAIDFSINATDDCSDEITAHLFIDGYHDANVFGSATVSLPAGTHTILWTLTDGCNNFVEEEYQITVVDCKKPTPVCINGLSSVVMPSSGQLTLWASDFDAPAPSGSFDNCTPQSDLRFRVRKFEQGNSVLDDIAQVLALETSVLLTCDDLGFANVELYVIDNDDNWDYCVTYVAIGDNNGACVTNELAAIEGYTATEDSEMVENVTVGVSGNMESSMNTDASGTYAFQVEMHNNYTVTPENDLNALNGVTTFDLVKISKHILGIDALDSPYKIIAADANASNAVTTLDLVVIRQLILGITTEFNSNTSWRFVDQDFVFPNPANPFMTNFPEVISFNSIDASELAADFVAVKIGDVNASAIPNTLLGTQNRDRANNLVFNVNEQVLEAGEEYTIEFLAKDFNDVLGYQFTLNFDNDAVEVLDVTAGELQKLTAANFGLNRLNEGVVTASWNDAKVANMKDNAVVFNVKVQAKANVAVSKVFAVSSEYTLAEAYNTSEEMGVAIAFNAKDGSVIAGNEFALYQNQPNPFASKTSIGFNLPQAGSATLSIMDISGKVLRAYNGDFAKGYNEFSVDADQLSGAGMLYYRLESANHTATRKMIILK